MTALDATNDLLNATPASKPEPVVQNGKYVIPRGGEKFTRCTTFASSLDDRYSLERWQQRMVGTGLVQRPDLYALWAANVDDRDELNELCEQAIEAAKASAGANLGTALHAFAEQIDRGETPVIPSPWDQDIAAYTACLEANGVRVDPALMEGVVVCRPLAVAGRFDRIVTIDGFPKPFIADLKTGSIGYAMNTIAIQLAIYANADELYDPDTDVLTPMPDVDLEQAVVIHLPAGTATCTLHMVDIKAGWEAAQLCNRVRSWRTTKNLSQSFESTTAERAKWLANRVATLKDRYPEALAELAARWPEGVPTFKQGGHTEDHLLAISLVLSDVEARHSVEFGDPDPARRRPPAQIVEALLERAAALPSDLRDLVEQRGRQASIPHLRSRQFAVAHVQLLEDLFGEVDAMYAARREQVRQLVQEVSDGDTTLVTALHAACGVAVGDPFTRAQADVLGAVVAGMSSLWLGYGETDGRITVVAVNGEERLVELYGSKKDALAAVKEIAETAGLAKPRSVADAAADPALVALAASAAINGAKEQVA